MTAKKAQAPRVEFSQKLFDAICGRIAIGQSVRQACDGDEMPNRSTFNEWRKRTPELQAQYDRACIEREEVYFEQIIEIADDGSRDEIEAGDGLKVLNPEWVQRSKVRIDARKWVLARMNRKKYGDSVTLSGDPDAPVQLVLNGSDVHG